MHEINIAAIKEANSMPFQKSCEPNDGHGKHPSTTSLINLWLSIFGPKYICFSQNLSQVPAHEDASFLETIDTTEPPAHYSSKHGEVDASQELALTPFTTAY
jgi:hypothetical protein